MELSLLFQKFGLALGLGLLVGMQRERSSSKIAGFRTFPLVTMFGTLCATMGGESAWPLVAAGLLAVTLLVVMGNLTQVRAGDLDPGMTTEIAVLVMFGLGAFLVKGPAAVAVVLGGTVALLLYLKSELHGFAKRIGEKDFRAMMIFVAIALVILPVLPDLPMGPYGVLNPRRIWWMVVLISGISLAGYLLYKFLGERAGVLAGAVLGGMISSTATTVSYARRTRENPEAASAALLVIVVAAAIVYVRVLITVGVFIPAHLMAIAPSLLGMLAILGLLGGLVWWRTRGEKPPSMEQGNPTEIKSALIFTALFALVLLAVAAARQHFGERGLYVISALSGLTDMDAITLSSIELVRGQMVTGHVAGRLILLASLANLVFKLIMVGSLGTKELFLKAAAVFGIALAAGGIFLWLW